MIMMSIFFFHLKLRVLIVSKSLNLSLKSRGKTLKNEIFEKKEARRQVRGRDEWKLA